jgi:hypothetical protein
VVRPNKSYGNADHISWLEPLPGSQLAPLNDQLLDADLFEVDVIHAEYAEIINFLQTNRMPEEYTLIGGILYKQDRDGVLRHCIYTNEIPMVLEGCHSDACGGHFIRMSLHIKLY